MYAVGGRFGFDGYLWGKLKGMTDCWGERGMEGRRGGDERNMRR